MGIDVTRGSNLRGKGRELQDICNDFPSVGGTFSNRENMQLCEYADLVDPSADDNANIATMIRKCGENILDLNLETGLGEDEVVGIVADWCAQTCAKVGVDPNRCQGPVTVDQQESDNSSGCLGEDTTADELQRQQQLLDQQQELLEQQQQEEEETNAENSEEEEQTIDDSSNEIDCQDNSEWTRDTIQGDYMNCVWVGKRSEERTKNRCKRDDAMENCPGTCNALCQGSVNYVGE